MSNLTWVDSEFILNTQKNKYNIQQTLNIFFSKFKTPLEWLNSSEKTVIVNNSSSEFGYILYWISQSNIWQFEEYRIILIDYILSNSKNNSLVNIPNKLGLLSDDEINKIKSVDKRISLCKIGAMCILLNKTLKDFTDSDIDSFSSYNNFFNKLNFSRKRLYSLRISLDYSNMIVPRNSRKTNWDTLYYHKKYGYIFREYRNILVSSNAKKSYLKNSSLALLKLLSFMEIEGIDSFENFNANTFESLVDYVSNETSPATAVVTIPKIKHFFAMNIGEDMFPKELEFCDTFWSVFSRKVKKLNKEKDGRAFSDIGLPKKIVNILIKFNPTTEVELVCKEFWLIIASCPVRLSYLLTLDAENALQHMPNNPNAYGLYSQFRDKAGNKYGQFPILDKIGLNAVKKLQERAKNLKFKPIYNNSVKAEFVHLLQLSSSPWVLNRAAIEVFFNDVVMSKIKSDYPNDAELRASAHSFRHFLITHVAMETGDETVCQTAAGHLDVKMTHTYLRSKASKNSLLLRVLDKYEKKEITGKFYLKLVEVLTSQDADVNHILYSVSTEMKVDAFFEEYGKKTHIGYCFNKENCSKWNACWGCNNFIMTRNEITEAIKILCHQMIALKSLTLCTDFSYEIPSVKNKLKLISLIIKRLTELGLSEENINIMTENCFNNIDIMTGVE